MRINDFFKLVIAVVISELAGVTGAFFTVSAIADPSTSSGQAWYAGLVKPALNPPAWVFGPVWTALYALMGISLFLIWKQHSHILKNVRMLWMWKWGITLFFIQLAINAVWSIIFFGFHSPGWAFVDIAALWLAIVWTMVVFYKISKPAAYLFVPYILWASFAGYLNFSIWQANKTPDTIFCTQEAKLCTDGSYVSRTGPNCEFALCPKENLIRVENIKANDTISSPLIVRGQARGVWFFEASFPIVLTDWDGRIIAEGYATAKDEWMTEDFVLFEGMLEFESPVFPGAAENHFSRRGYLILRKDNPSGLPEHDDALEIPILFGR